jgi:hypothetical protein
VAALGLSLAGPFALVPSCASNEVAVHLLLPADVEPHTAWIELGALPGPCPDLAQLAAGLPHDPSVQRIAYAYHPDDPNPPGLGELKRGAYAFMAAARARDCAVLATGCSFVDLDKGQEVRVTLRPPPSPASGACAPGTECAGAQCLPTGEGAGCSLALVGAGPLPDPMLRSGIVASAPALVVTDGGFLVVYRELDPFAIESRLTLIPLFDNGGRGATQHLSLDGTCTHGDESDGIGLAFRDGQGLLARSRAGCNGEAALDLLLVDGAGIVHQKVLYKRTGGRPKLARMHSIAPVPGEHGAFWVAFDEDARTEVVKVVGGIPQGSPIPFGGVPPVYSGTIASSDAMVALLAAVGGRLLDETDTDGGPAPSRPSRLTLAPAKTPLPGNAPFAVQAEWPTLAVEGTRVFLVSPGTVTSAPVRFDTYDLGEPAGAYTSFGVPGTGDVLGADVAVRNDRAFFAVERSGGIALVTYEHAGTTPVPFQTLFLPSIPRVPPADGLRDGLVAVAASETRVAVAWTTGQQLTRNEPMGGYAIFVCGP